MDIIVLTPNNFPEMENPNVDPRDSKIRYLEIKNKQFEKENNFLLSLLAKLIRGRTIVIGVEEFYHLCKQEHDFHIDKNLGGDILLTLVDKYGGYNNE